VNAPIERSAAQERCNSPNAHAEVERHQSKTGENTLAQIFLSELSKLEFELFWRIDAHLHKQRVHGIDGCRKAFLLR
jgi:hypothetical protein